MWCVVLLHILRECLKASTFFLTRLYFELDDKRGNCLQLYSLTWTRERISCPGSGNQITGFALSGDLDLYISTTGWVLDGSSCGSLAIRNTDFLVDLAKCEKPSSSDWSWGNGGKSLGTYKNCIKEMCGQTSVGVLVFVLGLRLVLDAVNWYLARTRKNIVLAPYHWSPSYWLDWTRRVLCIPAREFCRRLKIEICTSRHTVMYTLYVWKCGLRDAFLSLFCTFLLEILEFQTCWIKNCCRYMPSIPTRKMDAMRVGREK